MSEQIVHCKDCQHFHTDWWGIVNYMPVILAHEICDFWSGGCQTEPEGFCYKGELRKEEGTDDRQEQDNRGTAGRD